MSRRKCDLAVLCRPGRDVGEIQRDGAVERHVPPLPVLFDLLHVLRSPALLGHHPGGQALDAVDAHAARACRAEIAPEHRLPGRIVHVDGMRVCAAQPTEGTPIRRPGVGSVARCPLRSRPKIPTPGTPTTPARCRSGPSPSPPVQVVPVARAGGEHGARRALRDRRAGVGGRQHRHPASSARSSRSCSRRSAADLIRRSRGEKTGTQYVTAARIVAGRGARALDHRRDRVPRPARRRRVRTTTWPCPRSRRPPRSRPTTTSTTRPPDHHHHDAAGDHHRHRAAAHHHGDPAAAHRAAHDHAADARRPPRSPPPTTGPADHRAAADDGQATAHDHDAAQQARRRCRRSAARPQLGASNRGVPDDERFVVSYTPGQDLLVTWAINNGDGRRAPDRHARRCTAPPTDPPPTTTDDHERRPTTTTTTHDPTHRRRRSPARSARRRSRRATRRSRSCSRSSRRSTDAEARHPRRAAGRHVPDRTARATTTSSRCSTPRRRCRPELVPDYRKMFDVPPAEVVQCLNPAFELS